MRTLWEDNSAQHGRFGFYVADNQVLFEYLGPFDTDAEELIGEKAFFRGVDFEQGIEALDQGQECEIIGIGGEKLQLRLLATGSVSLTLHTGRDGGLTISDLGIKPSRLKLHRTEG